MYSQVCSSRIGGSTAVPLSLRAWISNNKTASNLNIDWKYGSNTVPCTCTLQHHSPIDSWRWEFLLREYEPPEEKTTVHYTLITVARSVRIWQVDVCLIVVGDTTPRACESWNTHTLGIYREADTQSSYQEKRDYGRLKRRRKRNRLNRESSRSQERYYSALATTVTVISESID